MLALIPWLAVTAPACSDDGSRPFAGTSATLDGDTFDPDDGLEDTTGLDEGSETTEGSPDETDDGTDEADDTDTGEPACDPSPSSWDPWVGGPCIDDSDCGYEGGVCLREDEGWPCGTCTLPCDLLCPDIADAPETFCIDETYVDEFAPIEGGCLAKCDPGKLGGNGCRSGYTCVLGQRFSEPETQAAVCVPEAHAQGKSECQQTLDELGVLWVPAEIAPESPESHPELECFIEDAVRLFSPIHGVDYRYVSFEEPTSMLVSCEMALALVELSDLLVTKNAVEVAHIGTYNCRVIAGTDTLSEHSFAHAIDLAGFTLEGGEYLEVLEHWEQDVADPVTFEGQWLKDLTDQRYDQGIFNIILTPNYNEAHANHFHVDLTPNASFYD